MFIAGVKIERITEVGTNHLLALTVTPGSSGIESYSLDSADLPGQSSTIADCPNDPMAQSGPSYGVEQPKSNAHVQNHRPTETTANPQPACCAAGRDETEWRAPPYVETLGEFYEPCQRSECFGGGKPNPTTIKRVIISRHFPSVFHRVQEHEEANPTLTGQDKTTDNRLFSALVFEEGEPVATLTDLSEGDGVVWNTPQIPLTVVGPAAIDLRGPAGGEYTLIEAEGSDAAYAIYDGYGCVSGVSRVPARDRPEGV